MKVFQQSDLMAAYAHAQKGEQALHLMAGSFAYLRKDTPSCFKMGGGQIAHLFDQDRERLVKTARGLGVQKILVEREGDPMRQHIDLCGKPLERALKMAADEAARVLAEFTNPDLGIVMETVRPEELARLREAAAYASFARPILEKLGDKNPLQEI